MIKFVKETYDCYLDGILNGTEEEKKRFFRIALENVERESRQAATSEVFKLANDLAQKQHYTNK